MQREVAYIVFLIVGILIGALMASVMILENKDKEDKK